MPDRIKCLLDGCNNTRINKPGFNEWICSKHWQVIPKNYRRLHAKAVMKLKKGQISADRLSRIWEKCKYQAYKNAWCV